MRLSTAALPVLALLASLGCAADLPDSDNTPGVVRADISDAKICTVKWGLDARHVSEAMKAQVFANYGFSGNQDPDSIGGGEAADRSRQFRHLLHACGPHTPCYADPHVDEH